MYEYLNKYSTMSEYLFPVIHPKEERKKYLTPTLVHDPLLARTLKVGIGS